MIGYLFKLARATVKGIFNEVYKEVWLEPADYVKDPTFADNWKKIASDLLERWYMHHCIDKLD